MTTENNKLLAEFLGFKNIANDEDKQDYLNDFMKFHTDWNWLMQVVEKIESLGYKETNVYVDISEGTFIHTLESNIEIAEVFGGTKIENTYNACVEFVKWYNNQIS
jgi:hypothetical protein